MLYHQKELKRIFDRESTAPCEHEYKNKKECQANRYHTDKINRSIKVYPNPNSGRFNIIADLDIDCKEVRIYNHHGKIVYRSSFKR